MAKKQIELTDTEFELLCGDPQIADEFASVIEAAIHDGENCHIAVTEEEFSNLVELASDVAANTTDRFVKRQFKPLAEYLKTL